MRLIVCGLMLVFLTACGKTAQAPATVAPAVAVEPPAPVPAGFFPPTEPAKIERKHFYEGKEDNNYFYSRGISDNEKQSGTVSNAMIEITYIGTKDDSYQFLMQEGNGANILSCKAPCDFFTAVVRYDGQIVSRTRFKNTPGSVAWAVFSDAAAGELDPVEMKINGKMQKAWFSAASGRFIPLDGIAKSE
jgi:hypothetical protein